MNQSRHRSKYAKLENFHAESWEIKLARVGPQLRDVAKVEFLLLFRATGRTAGLTGLEMSRDGHQGQDHQKNQNFLDDRPVEQSTPEPCNKQMTII